LAAHLPLAHESCAVAGVAQQGGEAGKLGVERREVVHHVIPVHDRASSARDDGGAGEVIAVVISEHEHEVRNSRGGVRSAGEKMESARPRVVALF
jgi:hypothetical protein